jgi:hypothetical protein
MRKHFENNKSSLYRFIIQIFGRYQFAKGKELTVNFLIIFWIEKKM